MNFTNSPYECMMKEIPHKEASAPQKSSEGTPLLLNTFHIFKSSEEQFLLFLGISALGHFVPKLRPGAPALGRS